MSRSRGSGEIARMKIIYASYTWWPPHFGGELLMTRERLNALHLRGHQAMVLTAGVPGTPSVEGGESVIDVYRSPAIGRSRVCRALRRVVFVVWLLKHLRDRRYDVLHLGSLPLPGRFANAVVARCAAALAHRRAARVVAVFSLADSEQRPLLLRGGRGTYSRALYGSADVAVAVSPALHDALAARFPKSAVLVMNGVQTDVFKPLSEPDRQAVRRKAGVPPDEVVFAFLGTVGRRKGFDVLAAAFLRLCREGLPARLWVLGPNSPVHNQNLDRTEVRAMLQLLDDVADRVRLWGRVDDRQRLRELLGAADAFVFPSRREGQGVAPLEAMALEVPVIVSRLPGITDQAAVEGESGLYVAPGDAGELARAMRFLAEDRECRRAMGAEGRRVILNEFGWAHHVGEWERVYAGASVEVGAD